MFIIDNHESISAHLERSIKSSFMGSGSRVYTYRSVWHALENSYVTPAIVLLNDELGQVNGIDSIPLLKQRFAEAKVIILSKSHDIKEFSRALANGADKYIQKNQWMLEKVNAIIKSYIEEHALEEKGYLIKILEKTLGMGAANRLAIIDGDSKLLFSLHYRLTKTLDMRVDPYTSLDDFYTNFTRFPDVMVLSDRFANTEVTQGDILRLKTLKPSIRIIMMSTEVSDPLVAEQLMSIGLDGFIHKDSNSFDLLEKMICV